MEREPAPEDYENVALEIASRFAGSQPRVRRFATGLAHFVFEATAEGRLFVIRISRPSDREIARNAARLSAQLRPLGVPLPEILQDGTHADIPFLVLERLPGRDLGELITSLPADKLDTIAERIARMQATVSELPSVGRYGYSADAEDAPFATWSEVLEHHRARSRRWILEAGLFDVGYIDALAVRAEDLRHQLNKIPATPFLHDTTTKNVIVTAEGELSGIVDVDDLCFGDPRHVVALTLTSLLNTKESTTYIDRWMQHAGFARDDVFWLYVQHIVVDFMSEHGHSFNGNQKLSSEEERSHLRALFQTVQARFDQASKA